MDCDTAREALSARIDGEEEGGRVAALDGHLRSCAACRVWEDRGRQALRATRVHLAEPVPDLTAAILAAAPSLTPRPRRAAADAEVLVLRLGLVMMAALQVIVALPELLVGTGGDAGVAHVLREQGAWQFGLAAGFLYAAFRPATGYALLPFVSVLAFVLTVTTVVDLVAGRTNALDEVAHLLPLAGAAVLWVGRHAAAPVSRGRALA